MIKGLMAAIIGALLVVCGYLYMETRNCYNPSQTFVGALTGASKMVVAETTVSHSINHTERGALGSSKVEISWMETQRFFVDFGAEAGWSVDLDPGGHITLFAPPIQAFSPGTIYTDSVRTYFVKTALLKNDTRHMLETSLHMSRHSKEQIAKKLSDPKEMAKIRDRATKSLEKFIKGVAGKLKINIASVTVVFSEDYFRPEPAEIVTPEGQTSDVP